MNLLMRASFYRQLGKIQSKHGLPSLALLQYYSRAMGMDYDTQIDSKQEKILVQNAIVGNKTLIDSVIKVCDFCGLTGEDDKTEFYRLIVQNGNMCDYFLTINVGDIIEKLEEIENCDGKDKLLVLLQNLDPDFNFKEYCQNNN